MRYAQGKIDDSSVSNQSYYSKNYADDRIAESLQYLADEKKKEREAKGECKTCFYMRSSRIGGAAITSKPCDLCGEYMSFGSTNTDRLCLECAVKNKICKRCGGDLHMRTRRAEKVPKPIPPKPCCPLCDSPDCSGCEG